GDAEYAIGVPRAVAVAHDQAGHRGPVDPGEIGGARPALGASDAVRTGDNRPGEVGLFRVHTGVQQGNRHARALSRFLRLGDLQAGEPPLVLAHLVGECRDAAESSPCDYQADGCGGYYRAREPERHAFLAFRAVTRIVPSSRWLRTVCPQA